MSENGWGYSIGGHVGKHPSDSTPSFRYFVNIAVSGSPATRMGYTEVKTVATNMDNGGNGAIVTGNFEETTQAYSPIDTGMALSSGVRYGIGALPTGGNRLQHGMYPAASINEAYEDFYEQTGLSVPPDPFNETSATNQGWQTLWINYDPNVAPAVPVNRTPSGALTDFTPHMEADFRDNNGRFGTDRGDRMSQFQVQVREVGNSSLEWDTTQNASQAEKDADHFDTIYAGTTLVAGEFYEWRCRVADHFGEWSAWSSWLAFNYASTSVGSVVLDGTPTGKQEAISGITFQGRWSHPASTAMNAVEVRIYQGASLIHTSATITKAASSSAPPGTIFNVTQAEIGVTLQWGVDYAYAMRGRGSDGLWSNWTSQRSFNTNAKPATPSNLDPANSQASSTLPLLTMQMTDADDSTATGLIAEADIISQRIPNNPSFNGNVTNWSAVNAAGVTAAITYDAAQNQDGVGGAGKINISASSAASGITVTKARNDLFVPVIVGESYSVNGYLRTDQANLWPGVGIEWYTSADVLISTSVSESAATINTWVQRSLTAVAPATAAKMKFVFTARSNAANQLGNIHFDAATFPGWTVRYRRSMTHLGAGVWSYQTTSTDLSAFDTYRWRARGNDGTVSSSFSPDATFIYATGPVVTMLTPTANQVIVTNTPNITWSVTDQVKFEVFIYEQDGAGGTGPIIYDSGEIVSGTSAHLLPSGVIHNGGFYRVRVQVTNSLAQSGISPHRNFSVDYGPVVPLTNVFASEYSMDLDPCPSGILISWDESFYPSSQHEAYAVYRREASQPTSYNLLIGRITNVGQNTFLDYQPASQVEYVYAVTQMVRIGLDIIESVPIEVAVSISLCGTVLSAADDGDTYRVVAQFWSERGMETQTDGNQIIPWGSTKPTTMFGSAYFRTIQFTAKFVTNEFASIYDYSLASDSLLARRGVVCFRDPKGRKIFGVLSKLRETDEAMGTLRQITYELTEVNYSEAV